MANTNFDDEQVNKLACAIKAREDFYFFSRYTFYQQKKVKFIQNWHHKLICDKLMDVYNGKCKRLIINLPPRYTKTELAAVRFIAWCLGKAPHSQFIHATYSKTLATNNSWQARNVVQSDFYHDIFPDVFLCDDSNKKDEWRTTQGGIVYATGADGTITGYGAGSMNPGFGGAIIIDDPHKAGEASSAVRRNNVIDWYQGTMESRLNTKDTPIILIMQRLHEEDLAGWLLAGGNGEEWENIKIPAIITENGQDKPLWEYKHDLDDLDRMRKANPYVFAGQYMQEPSPVGGAIFKEDWWKYYEILPKMQHVIVVADTAMKAKEENDYSVFICMGLGDDGNCYVIDLLRGKWEAPELRRAFVNFWNKQKATHKVSMAYVEDKASGTGLIQTIQREDKIPIEGLKPESKDKVQRANSVVGYVSSGYTNIKGNAEWTSEFISELSVFPNGKHDDQVDAFVYGLDKLYNRQTIMRIRQL